MAPPEVANAWSYYEEGQRCHYRCDLIGASRNYAEAAIRYVAGATKERAVVANISRFNAAICYFLAGDYDKSLTCLDQVNVSRLDEGQKQVAEMLHEECYKKKRSSYWETIKDDLRAMQSKKMHKDILELLRNNPYVLDSAEFAKQFRDSCYSLGMWEVAKAFEKDMTRLFSGLSSAVPPTLPLVWGRPPKR
jgi:tetratricopeptide (TPR) repeat protein